MKKIVSLSLFILISFVGNSQTRKFELGLIPELGLPLGNFNKIASPAIGINLKGSYSLTPFSQVTLTVGYTGYNIKDLPVSISSTYSIIPVLVGYRNTFKHFIFEPQIGMGFYSLRLSNTSGKYTDNNTNFTWATSTGYDFGNFEIILRYLEGSLKNAGSNKLTVFGIGLHYTLPL